MRSSRVFRVQLVRASQQRHLQQPMGDRRLQALRAARAASRRGPPLRARADAVRALEDGRRRLWECDSRHAATCSGYITYDDQTALLKTNAYYASYNLPFYARVSELSGFDKKASDGQSRSSSGRDF